MIGLLEVLLVAATLLAALTWAAVGLLAPRCAPEGGSARRRLLLARLWLHAPLWLPGVALLATLVPGVLGNMLGWGDHCLTHVDHHHHLCLFHPPHAARHVISWLVPLVLGLPVALMLGRGLWQARSWWRLTRTLVAASKPSTLGANVRLLERPEPVALTVGWWRPVILLSQGLIDQVKPGTLQIILAHERAHVARHDTRQALLDRFAASLLPRAARERLLRDVSLAREQACDAIAADQLRNPLQVAAALTEVARLRMVALAPGLSVASSSIEARVLHLLHPEEDRWQRALLAPVTILMVLMAGAGPLHTVVERLVSLLLH